MKAIGITGGIGSGKSLVMEYLRRTYRVPAIEADRMAKELIKPSGSCYEKILSLIGRQILSGDGMTIDHAKMAEAIFQDASLLKQVNGIIHPQVIARIESEIESARQKGLRFFFVEAALLIEPEYRDIVDELWYICTNENTRARRLRETRGYSLEKIESVLRSQRDDSAYRSVCSRVIVNEGDERHLYAEIDRILREER